jgi:hypothetical protein
MTTSFVLASIQPRRTRRHGDATLCIPLPSITANSKYRSNGGAVFIGRHSISGRHSKNNLVYPNSDLSTGFPWVHLGDTAVHEAEAAHRGSGQPIPGSPLGPTGPVPAAPDFELVNAAFLKAGGTAEQFRAGIQRSVDKGWLAHHESGTYVKVHPGGR